MWNRLVDRVREYQVVPVLVGFFSSYLGEFIAEFVGVAMKVTSGTSADVVFHPEQASFPDHAIFRHLVVLAIHLAFITAGGFGAAMLARQKKVDQAVFAASIYVVLHAIYCLEFTFSGQTGEVWSDWLVVLLAVPCAWFGGRRYASSD